MNTNHAPGPWTVNGKTIKSVHHQRHYTVARVGNDLFTPEANEANARLIAAAPDLLEMLDRAVRRLEIAHANGDSIMREWVIDARAAINKATGETNHE